MAGRDVESELVERYVEAHRYLELGGSAGDSAVLRVAVEHPRLIPFLDAAAALARPNSLLHKKALLMAAILEATPQYASEFLPRTLGWFKLGALMASVGLMTAVHVAVGLPLLRAVERRV